MDTDKIYAGREQARVKHEILRRYLVPFACKVGSTWNSITYVDAFCGPWESRTKDFSDTSFKIAIDRLLEAQRSLLVNQKRQVQMRFAFVEQDSTSFAQLKTFCDKQKHLDICTVHAPFADSLPTLTKFIGKRSDNFVFVFIDPLGWTDANLDEVVSLLLGQSSEVLINFMTHFVQRQVGNMDPDTQEKAASILGGTETLKQIRALSSAQDKEDLIVQSYCNYVRMKCKFSFVAATPILFPAMDRTFYHLVYGSRNIMGLSVFRDVERRATDKQQSTRDGALQAKRKSRGERLLFSAEVMGSSHLDNLRAHHNAVARAEVLESLMKKKTVGYDDLFAMALAHQLTSEQDLWNWISLWKKEGWIEVVGTKGTGRPDIRSNASIRWLK
ncbi:MAG TPA: three-Cys-motif partner protein TcmP [Planctomycetota bacterium]|nr:three-Cys-motif partner protein TcmP [Planctomycetota bacterium]